MSENIFAESVVTTLGPVPITGTMLTSSAVSVALIAIGWFVRAALRRFPGGPAATLGLMAVESLDRLVSDTAGRPEPSLATLVGGLFLFIAACNLSGQLPGVRPPTASLATTSALAAIVFLAVPVAGVRARGLAGYLRGYFRPHFFLAPLHVISELSRTLALSVRLFGNILSGHLIVALLVSLTGFFVPVPLMALDVLIGLLQAYIFAILATVYVGAALRAAES